MIKKYNDNKKLIYEEDPKGRWGKYEYNDKGKLIYREYSDGWWAKYEYDDRNKLIYEEDLLGICFNKKINK